jgi:hypothetical protein
VSGRCYTITLPDGTQAIVRTGKRGWKPTPADLKAIAEMREILVDRGARGRCLACGGVQGSCKCYPVTGTPDAVRGIEAPAGDSIATERP